MIMARTDALAVEGLDAAIERAQAYVEAGAEMLFPEAITELAMYRQFADAVQVPILANITEFGATPLFTTDELRSAHVAMALYPLSAFRAMNRAAEHVYNVLRQEGTQKASSIPCKPATSCTKASTTTSTKRSSTTCLPVAR